MVAPKILVAPLNWGLGHATRSIPIIKYLTSLDLEVHLASDGQAYEVLREEYPTLPLHKLAPLEIKYGKPIRWRLLSQLPKFLSVIRKDQRIASRLFDIHSFDVIISDNRYGVYHPDAINILVTHQLRVLHPPVAEKLSRWALARLMKPFDECWIPDDPGNDSLSGALADVVLSIPKHYIGPLSRMSDIPTTKKTVDACIVISGPEPTRTQFEETIWKQIEGLTHLSFVIVRGLPGQRSKEFERSKPHIQVINFANKTVLAHLYAKSKCVISRSGYTSIMDYSKVGQKAILVPTSGQPEQEYLAKYLSKHNLFLCRRLEELDVQSDIEILSNRIPEHVTDTNIFRIHIDRILNNINSGEITSA